jgi:hypothetical protein
LRRSETKVVDVDADAIVARVQHLEINHWGCVQVKPVCLRENVAMVSRRAVLATRHAPVLSRIPIPTSAKSALDAFVSPLQRKLRLPNLTHRRSLLA